MKKIKKTAKTAEKPVKLTGTTLNGLLKQIVTNPKKKGKKGEN
jgi:hypothetical protein